MTRARIAVADTSSAPCDDNGREPALTTYHFGPMPRAEHFTGNLMTLAAQGDFATNPPTTFRTNAPSN